MERFLRLSPHITRCTYAPGTIGEDSFLVHAAGIHGTVVPEPPVPIQSVRLLRRPIYHNEPDGEPQLLVLHTVDGQRTVIDNLKHVYDRDAYRAEIFLELAPDEKIFGFGQDEDGRWNKRGTMEYLYQHNMKIPMPMFVSSRGYAILADCGCLMTFDSREDVAVWTLECVQQVDLYVLQGTMDEIVASYRQLTGRAAPLPDWALGYWQSKERYESQEELLDVARRYRELHIPLDVVVQDWKTWVGDLWGDKHLDKERFPNVCAMKEQMDALHVHTLVSVWPNMNPGGEDHKEFADAGLLLHDYSTYNAFDPKGRDLYWKQASRELYPSFDGWWCDSTEPFTSPDWCGEKKLPEGERYRLVGGEHETYLDPAVANCYALAHAKGIWEHQPEKPVVNLTRSGWAGIQQYGAILWAGDTAATWQELRREIAKAMSISICGIPYWTVDAGAFFTGGTACWRKWKGDPDAAPVWFWHGDYDKGVQDPAYQELYTRWLQFTCFLPIFRSHGTDTPREVWNFQEPYRSAIAQTIRLRYRLMPYLKDMARRVTEEHFTMVRSLMFDFPEEPESADVDDEYLFGNDLLVCPVTEPMAQTTVRRCWLPKGADWYDLATARYYPGGQTVEVTVTLENIPVFVRAGTTLELQTDLQYAAEDRPVLRTEYSRK